MSLFHKSQSKQNEHNDTEEEKPKPKIEFNITIDGKSYVSGMRTQPQNEELEEHIKKHLAKLLTFYQDKSAVYKYDTDITAKFIKQISPNANNNTCPYCGVIHPFTASRARKCPACGEKMVVRDGVFLKEVDAEKLQNLTSDFYSKAQDIERLKNTIQSAQDDKQRRNYGRSFLEIAEAYELCAVIHNQSYVGGFTNWDYAWSVLNKDALEAVSTVSKSQTELLSNGYADILYARGMHLLREMKYAEKEKAQSRYAQIAIGLFYDYLIELARYHLNHWQQNDAIKNIHIALNYAHVTEEQNSAVVDRIESRPNLAPPVEIVAQVDKSVKDYVLVETDPDRLKWMIY